ncbi:MAG: alpha-amylase family glycosyl hydrolase [Caldilineaceae bacterium]
MDDANVQEQAGQGSGANESVAGYHGYWTVDYTQIDPHFGSNAEMTALVNAAHTRHQGLLRHHHQPHG